MSEMWSDELNMLPYFTSTYAIQLNHHTLALLTISWIRYPISVLLRLWTGTVLVPFSRLLKNSDNITTVLSLIIIYY